MKLRRHSIVRRAALVILLIAVVSGLLWQSQSFHRPTMTLLPMRIFSGSMAPALLGPHRRKVCEDCGLPFEFDALKHCGTTCICPNCGMRQEVPADIRPGDRVDVVPQSQIRRGQVIAFRQDRAEASRSETKRVIGLPGEQVEIRKGDVWLDGQLLRKNVSEMQDVAMRVYADSARPRSAGRKGRWRNEVGGRWYSQDGTHSWCGTQDVDDGSGWLVYHHSEGLPPPFVRNTPMEVTDNYAYNQSESRLLHQVDDWFVTLQVRADAITFRVMLFSHQQTAVVNWDDSSGAVSLGVCGVSQAVEAHGTEGRWTEVLVGCWDQQWVLALDGAEVFRVPMAESNNHAVDGMEFDESPLLRPFRVAARGTGEIQVRDMQLWRDIYYTQVGLRPTGALPRLGKDEFLVLGDNSPISRDARYGKSFGIVHRRNILGGVIKRD